MKTCAFVVFLLPAVACSQFACNSTDSEACSRFGDDLRSCIQFDCCVWNGWWAGGTQCMHVSDNFKCPVEYYHRCASHIPSCSWSMKDCGACSGDPLCSWSVVEYLPFQHTSSTCVPTADPHRPSGQTCDEDAAPTYRCLDNQCIRSSDASLGTSLSSCEFACGPAPAPTPPIPAPPITTTTTTTTPLVAGFVEHIPSGNCLNLAHGNTENGQEVHLRKCDGREFEHFAFSTSPNQLVYVPDPTKCVDVRTDGEVFGEPLVIWDCKGDAEGGETQRWKYAPWDGHIYRDSNECLVPRSDMGGVQVVRCTDLVDAGKIWSYGSNGGSSLRVAPDRVSARSLVI